MNRPRRAAARAALLLAIVPTLLASASPASALNDPWTRWVTETGQTPDVWIRSLDFIGPKLFAASEGDGIFTSLSPVGKWLPSNGGLDTVTKQQVRQVVSKDGTLYAATSAGLFKSATGGASWTQLGTGAPPRRLTMGGIQTVMPNSTTDLVVGTASFGVYYSSDSGAQWDKATGFPANESVFHIVNSPSTPSTLYAAAADGVFISLNKGRTWTLSSDGLPFANVLRVAVSPLNPSVIYAATTSGLYRSGTGGLLWRSANGKAGAALSNTQVRAIFLAPAEFGGGGRLMVGTAKGVWASKNSGATWGQMGKDTFLQQPAMSNEIVWSLGIGFTPPALMAGTQGHGIFSHTLLPIVYGTAPKVTPATGVTVGKQLTATTGTWSGTRPYFFAFQWKRCSSTGTNCANIAGARGATYNVVDADVGHKLRAYVTAGNVVAPLTITKNSAGVPSYGTVKAAPTSAPFPTSNPTLTPHDASYPWGKVYTLSNGTWTVDGKAVTPTFKYSWARCPMSGTCTTVAGQTAKTYTSTGEDVDHSIQGFVTASYNGASTTRLAGQTFTVIQKTPVNTALPKIYGTPAVGSKLSSNVGTWTAVAPTFARRWLACEDDGTGCNPIFGATAPTFTPTAALVGKRIKLEVTATSEDQSAKRIAVANSVPTGAVK